MPWSAAVINISDAYIITDSVRVMIRSSHQHWFCLHYHRQCPCYDPQQSPTLVLLTLPPTVSVSWSAAVANISVAYIITDSVRVMIRSSHQHWFCLHYHRQCPCHDPQQSPTLVLLTLSPTVSVLSQVPMTDKTWTFDNCCIEATDNAALTKYNNQKVFFYNVYSSIFCVPNWN